MNDGLEDLQMSSYVSMLDRVLRGRLVEVRGEKYREIVPQQFSLLPLPREFFSKLNGFNVYIADARVHYIIEKSLNPMMTELSEMFAVDMNTRQAVVYKPDWYWDGDEFGHVNCVVAYMFQQRDRAMDLHVFMRSSDLWNAFPFDWYAMSEHLKWFTKKINAEVVDPKIQAVTLKRMNAREHMTPEAEQDKARSEMNVEVGQLFFHTSNLHVLDRDVKNIEKFIERRLVK